MKTLFSFEDFAKKATAPVVAAKTEAKQPQAKPVAKPLAKPAAKVVTKPVRESALLVDTDYKVKVSLDVPVALIKSYIDKVKSETGKDPLQGNTEPELAEEIVRYLVKKNLVIDQIPSSLSVGQGEADATMSADAPTEEQNDAPVATEPAAPAAEGEDVYAGAEEIDMPDEEEETEAGDHKGIDFETQEAQPGEGKNIQLDPNQKTA
jgi:uncharacterized membrane protein